MLNVSVIPIAGIAMADDDEASDLGLGFDGLDSASNASTVAGL